MKKRLITFVVTVCFAFTAIIGRLGYIIFSGKFAVSSTYNSYTLTIDKLYPTVYDRNFKKLTNKSEGLAAVIRPTEKCLSELELLFDKTQRSEIIDELRQGYPVIKRIENYSSCKYIKIFNTKNRHDDNTLAIHLITDCEKLYSDHIGSKTVNFAIDAIGRLLDGDEGTVLDNNYSSKFGAVLTIDTKIQETVEAAAEKMNKGAVVVLDIQTGDVLASCSKPNDYLNRAFNPYTVGSVFKLVISACALENKLNPIYNCEGEITVGDTVFSCQHKREHGLQTIKEALANSCNCYFINLALALGYEKVYKTAESFGFGESTGLADAWNVTNGNFPDESELRSKGQLALIGFGQGKLTTTPLHFASVVATIANGGKYISPNVLFGEANGYGEVTRFPAHAAKRIISEKTAETLQEYMRYVVTNGTGSAAEYDNNSAGKTSTAQSGIFVDGKEILNTWFAGFYPYNEPRYAIVVMTEDGVSGSSDCCPIFRTIVENLD
ncbi:MAG: penicillin-binding protein 2 [Eubacterium sp.]|nr:penicillin-binding protein 2 [Eubacterium sp.]